MASYHSSSFHKYFEGYTEVLVPKKNGKGTRIRRVYTGVYFSHDMTDRQWVLYKIAHALLFVLGAALFGLAAGWPVASNDAWYVGFCVGLTLIGLLWLLLKVATFLIAKRKMTVASYRECSKGIYRGSLVCASCLGVLAAAKLIFLCSAGTAPYTAEMMTLAGVLCAIAVFVCMNRLEARVSYVRQRSSDETTGNGVEINR